VLRVRGSREGKRSRSRMVNAVRYTFCVFCVYLLTWVTSVHFESLMDRLPLETQEQLKKMSTERLRLKLGKTGFDEDRLWELDRAGLLDPLAEIAAGEIEADPTGRLRRRHRYPLPQRTLAAWLLRSGVRPYGLRS